MDVGSAAGLYYFRNRYCDPDLRRWISEDPLGLGGGPNWYAYVGNKPINLADPWGLKAEGDCTRWVYYYYQQGDRIVLGAACASRRRSGASETAGSRAVGPGNGGPDEPGRGVGAPRGAPNQAPGGNTPPVDAGSNSWACAASIGQGVAAFALDAGLLYLYMTGLSFVGHGLLLWAEGQAISSGLILTATLESAGATGVAHVAAGKTLLATGTAVAGGVAAAVPTGISILPGGNLYNWYRDGGLSACR